MRLGCIPCSIIAMRSRCLRASRRMSQLNDPPSHEDRWTSRMKVLMGGSLLLRVEGCDHNVWRDCVGGRVGIVLARLGSSRSQIEPPPPTEMRLRPSTPRCRKLLYVSVALMAIVGAAGCVTVEPVGSDGAIELSPDQGILVIHLSSRYGFQEFAFSSGGKIPRIEGGEQLELFVVRAGSYRFTRINVSRLRFLLRREDQWEFRIEPGRINYLGMLELRQDVVNVKVRGLLVPRFVRLSARMVDRSAMAMDSLRERHPGLLERNPLVYSGSGRSVFFEQLRAAELEGHEGRDTGSLAPEPEDTRP